MQNLTRLHKLIIEHFNLSELQDLAFDLQVPWDEIEGGTLTAKTRNLLTHLQRRKRIPLLLETLQKKRANINWLETATDTTPSPYRGLKAFRLEDEHLFFGREALTSHLVEVAKEQSFVPVLGPSGSGKSSVVMAGLLPQLLRQGSWLPVSFRPGAKPFQALMQALLEWLFPNNVAQQMKELNPFVTMLSQREISLQTVIERILAKHEPDTKLLIVADQFEELYTLCLDRELRHNFLDQLLEMIAAARTTTQPTHLFLVTLRSDFLGQAQNDYVAFTRALHNGRMVLMEPMDRAGLQEAIKYPALNAGVGFERHLVERIIDDVAEEPGQLPLLEFALDLLWEKREDNKITLVAYEEIGRVAGALAQYADQQYKALTKAEQEQARHIFLRLVQPGEETLDMRRLAKRAEVSEISWPLVTRLASQRLLVTSQNMNGEETVEVIHEALIWGWKRLQAWVDADRVFLTQLNRLRRVYQQWQRSGKKEGDLLRGTFLERASQWRNKRASDLSNEETNFIQKSLSVHIRDLLIPIILRGDAQGKDLSQAPLMGTNLVKSDLYETVLWKANLNRTDLSESNLGRADLREADLRGANLSRAELSHVDLSGARLIGVILRGTILKKFNLSRFNLNRADLSLANLSLANLSRANLKEAVLRKTDMSWAILRKANLSRADLSWANLKGADLRGANLSRADLRLVDLSGAILQGSKIDAYTQIENKWRTVWEVVNNPVSGKDLKSIDLSGATLRGSHLRRANLKGANLSKTNLSEADLSGADLSGAILQGSKIDAYTQIENKWHTVWEAVNNPDSGKNLRGIDLSGADLSGANLAEADLSGADLSGADLSGAVLINAVLQGSKIDAYTQIENKWHTVWKVVNNLLSSKDLSYTDLSWANLKGADLRSANLEGAYLKRADLRNSDLRGTNLRDANLRGACLRAAHLDRAILNRAILAEADLSGVDLSKANLGMAVLGGAFYNTETLWPKDFDPQKANAVLLESLIEKRMT